MQNWSLGAQSSKLEPKHTCVYVVCDSESLGSHSEIRPFRDTCSAGRNQDSELYFALSMEKKLAKHSHIFKC